MLATILSLQSNPQDIEDLIKGLFTPKELAEIEKRLQIVAMLKAKIPQHTIADKLNVGVATVTRGSRELQQGRFSQIKADPNAWRNSQP